ncbi:MAG: hypothetical protein Fur0037_16030 [Planctomycetota bacterium]
MAARKDGNPAFDFIVSKLKANKDISYADVKAAADKKKLKIFPIMFGRAKVLLGYVKASPRGKGKASAKKAADRRARTATARPRKKTARRGRPRRSASASLDMSSLDGIIAAVRSSQQEKERYRSALEKIQTVLSGILG